ncbi:MAG: H-NS histone family protein [Aliishimia sp.]
MSNDMKNMSKKQLDKLLKEVQKALKALETKEKREAKKAAEKAVAKFGFKLSDLTGGTAASAAEKPAKRKTAKKSPSVAKYANPEDSAQTWTGKGRQPNWYRAQIENGTSPESMEV